MDNPSEQDKSNNITYREATHLDLPAIVLLLADDPLGAKREDASQPLKKAYRDAFKIIESDPNNLLYVAEHGDRVMGVLQLTFIPYLTYQGSWRALIEGVRVHRDYRSDGVGRRFFQWATERARERGCHMVQLTSDKARPDAVRFYESLGFKASHEGLKLLLKD